MQRVKLLSLTGEAPAKADVPASTWVKENHDRLFPNSSAVEALTEVIDRLVDQNSFKAWLNIAECLHYKAHLVMILEGTYAEASGLFRQCDVIRRSMLGEVHFRTLQNLRCWGRHLGTRKGLGTLLSFRLLTYCRNQLQLRFPKSDEAKLCEDRLGEVSDSWNLEETVYLSCQSNRPYKGWTRPQA